MTECNWCGLDGLELDEDYIAGHNTRRTCRMCRKRWCTQYPIESYAVVWSFCSPTCRTRWPRARRCEMCDQPLPVTARADCLTCSIRCRVALHRRRLRDVT